MARPKNTPGTISAQDRIELAFWDLLAKNNYTCITIASLCKKAEINHNTFYYHFENIDDMAVKLFQKNLANEILEKAISNILNHTLDSSFILSTPSLKDRWERARLFTRGDSAFLTDIFKSTVMDAWLNATNIDKSTLSPEDSLELDFIFSGLTAILGNDKYANPILVATILDHDLGKGITATLQRIISKQKNG